MTLDAVPGLLVAFVVVMLPGVALLLALRVRRLLWVLGAAPAASIGVATVTAIVCALLGLQFGPVTFGVVTLVLLAVGLFLWSRDRRQPAEPGEPRARAGRVAVVLGVVLAVVGIGYIVHTWMLGLGGTLTTVPQEHDTIVHSELVAYIQYTGRGAPWQLLPLDLITGTPTGFYPSGMHLLAAVTGGIMGDPLVGLNAVTVIMLGVVLAFSVGALAYVALRRVRAGADGAIIGAGIAMVVVAGLNSPIIPLISTGGIMANATGLALTPGVVAVLLSLRPRDWLAAVAAGFACAGAVLAHPSAAISVLVTFVAWLIGELFSKGGPRRIASQIPPLLVVAVIAGVLAAASLIQATASAGTTSAWPPDFPKLAFSEAVGQTFTLPYLGYLPQYAGLAQVAVLGLAVLGIIAVLMSRRGFGPVFAYGTWSLLVLGAWLTPGSGFENKFTGFFYNAMVRIRAHQALLVPVLAALGIVLTARALAAWLARRPPLRATRLRATWLSAALIAVVMLVYLLVPATNYAQASVQYLKSRYGAPDLIRISADDQAAFNFLVGKVGPGERVMNSANDGSTYLYVEKNIPVVNVSTLGDSHIPYSYQLLERFNTYPKDAAIRKQILDLNITWVYSDDVAPLIGATVSPDNWWKPGGLFSVAPGLMKLNGLPGLTEEFHSGAVHVYRVDQNVLRKL
jgi:hypothetical protein